MAAMGNTEPPLREIHATDAINPERWDVHCDKTNDKVMMCLLYGSWNLRRPNYAGEFPKLVSLVKANLPESKTIAAASIKVDADDESYDVCVNEMGAPSELPAILFIGAPSASSGITDTFRVECVSLSGGKLDSLLSCDDENEANNKYEHLLGDLKATWSRLVDSDGKLRPAPVKQTIVKTKATNSEPAIRIFIAGDRSQVGKSSICMGILGALLKSGKYNPSDLAYIKPATQCEQTQLVQEFCKSKGITACVPIGPIVYYKGFTRAFLKGEIGETSEQLLLKAGDAVDELALGKKVVIIDGVGYPAVGSITGTDNASVARSCGSKLSDSNGSTSRIPVPVLLIGKSGVGDAVDSFNINATYFAHRDVPVIGAIFNKLSLEGFYSLDNCKEAIEMYFHKFQPGKAAFGFIPEISALKNARENLATQSEEEQLKNALETADAFVDQFMQHVNVDRILQAAEQANNTRKVVSSNYESNSRHRKRPAAETSVEYQSSKQTRLYDNNGTPPPLSKQLYLTRAQIEAMASAAGAAGG